MIEAGSRRRNQPAPPHVVCEALLHVEEPHLVLWSSLWVRRPDARVHFDLPHDAGHAGTDLPWTLLVAGELPEPPLLGHLRKRLNQLVDANLRYTFGQ